MERVGKYILREGEQDKLILANGLKYIISNKKYYSPKREVEKVVGYTVKFEEIKGGENHKYFTIYRG